MQSSSNNISLTLAFALAFTLYQSFPAPGFAQPAESEATEGGGSMSGRFKKYINEDNQDMPGMGRHQRIREKLQNMPPEQREMFLQRMRQRKHGNQGWQPMPGSEPGFEEGPIPGPGLTPGAMPAPERMEENLAGRDGPSGKRQPRMGMGIQRKMDMTGQMGIPRGGNMRQGFGALPGRAIDFSQLNLSEKQKNSILALRSKHAEQAKLIQKNLRSRRMEMRNMLFSPDLNKKILQEKRNELRTLQNQLDDIMMDDFLGIRALLSEEQIKKLAETNLPQKQHAAEALP